MQEMSQGNKSTGLQARHYAIIVLVVATALLHLAASRDPVLFPGGPDPLFTLNGLGYLGLLGAYFLLQPLASIRVLFFLGFIPIVAHIPALIFLGLWFAAQIASATFSVMSEPGIAVWAHVGGFLTGMLLTPFLRQ